MPVVVAILGSLAGVAALVTAIRALLMFQSERAQGALNEAATLIAQSRTMREDAVAEYGRLRARLEAVTAWGRRGWARVRELGGEVEPEP